MVDGTVDPASWRNGGLSLMSEPSNYLDAIWMVQKLAKLDDAEMQAADALLRPLLRQNGNKLPIDLKDGVWYWGPFPLNAAD
jgi:hypothetical protein